MKKTRVFIATTIALLFFAVPALSSAAALTEAQSISLITVVQSSPSTPATAFVPLITAFSNITVNQAESLITVVQASPSTPANAFVALLTSFTVDTVTTPPVALSLAHVPVVGSPYPASTLGYDVSFNTTSYPTSFQFGIFSVTRGKAFRYNTRLSYEYRWAQFGSAAAPTLYMNLNAPYGTTVAGHVDSPRDCSGDSVSSSTEPTVCQGYNYGYNAAQDAYAFAKGSSIESKLWWLDIEEANSWSPTLAVNDATIQGAIDYLNTQGIRVGIYSMTYMWNNIAGKTFIPKQTINGVPVVIPLWVPVGTRTLVGAINTCNTATPFIAGSPIWLIQYEENSTAIDQNVAC